MKTAMFFLFFIMCLISKESIGQEQNMSPELLAWYQETLPFFQEMITGGQYSDPPDNYLGTPFYKSVELGFGQIWINGLTYTRIQLLYDAWQDEVLTFHPVYNEKILIKAEKIEKFILADGSVFLRISANPGYSKHNHGFYQVISVGEPMLLKKHFRSIETINEPGLIKRRFTEDQDYFFWFQNEFRQVGSKKEATVILGLSGKSVNNHFKENGMVFKKDPQGFLLEMLRMKKIENEDFTGFPTR